MSFLAAIPLIGSLFEKVGEAIDKNVTTEHERLMMKAELTGLYTPVLVAVLGAQQSANEMQAKIAEVEAKSEHWLVWARRPIISILAFVNAVYAGIAAAKGYPSMDAESAFYLALLANGLDMGTRGIEKVIKGFKGKEL